MRIEFCCECFEDSLGKENIYREADGFYINDDRISYCPFCGEKIEMIIRHRNKPVIE